MEKFIVLILVILGLMSLSIVFLSERIYIPPIVTSGLLSGIAGSLAITAVKLWLAERKTANEKKEWLKATENKS